MEAFGNSFDEEWENLSRMFSGDQDSDHFTGHGLLSSEHDHGLNFETSSIFWPTSNESSNTNSSVTDNQSLFYAFDSLNPSFCHYFSQESTNSSSGANNGMVSLPYPSHDSYQFCPPNIIPSPTNNVCNQSVDLCMMDESTNHSALLAQVFSDNVMEEILCLRQDVVEDNGKMEHSDGQQVVAADPGKEMLLKRKFEMPELLKAVDDEANTEKSDKNPKKKARVSRDNNKNKKNVQTKKNQKMVNAMANANRNDGEENNNDNNNNGGAAQSSSSCSSEDDSNASQEGAVNLNGKTRASRGAATDPQSLYARKRRERINERLRILQNLVPNGTKVDISTMLEEAVHYVKFLQLQIKLLSSDDMWMFAPIAYNGMDMGLYQKISPTQ